MVEDSGVPASYDNAGDRDNLSQITQNHVFCDVGAYGITPSDRSEVSSEMANHA